MNNSSNQPRNPFHPQQQVQNIFYKLKQLNEIQDESRNELCPVFQDQESTNQQLKHINKKLKDDNVKLFAQCIKLKKKCQGYESKQVEDQRKKIEYQRRGQQFQKMEIEVGILREEIEEVMRKNRKLEERVKEVNCQSRKVSSLGKKFREKQQEIEQMASLNIELTLKVQKLQKQLQLSQSRILSKSSQSGSLNNTTQQSRKTQQDKDRMLSNLKIVHQSEVRKLKGIIDELKKQSTQSEYGLVQGHRGYK